MSWCVGAFDSASVRDGLGPVSENFGIRSNANSHLPLPITEDPVDILRFGLKQAIAEKKHGRNAVVGPPTHS